MSEKLKRAYTTQARHRPHPHFLSRSTLNRPLRLPGSVELVTALTSFAVHAGLCRWRRQDQ